jgi:hypothetical protein
VTPSPAPVVNQELYLNFEYRANANAYIPALTVRGINAVIPPAAAALLPKPLFAGMAPGSVGAYQINFIVPPVTNSVPNCDQYSVVSSNLTVTVFSVNSSDAVGICVDASGGPGTGQSQPTPAKERVAAKHGNFPAGQRIK